MVVAVVAEEVAVEVEAEAEVEVVLLNPRSRSPNPGEITRTLYSGLEFRGRSRSQALGLVPRSEDCVMGEWSSWDESASGIPVWVKRVFKTK